MKKGDTGDNPLYGSMFYNYIKKNKTIINGICQSTLELFWK